MLSQHSNVSDAEILLKTVQNDAVGWGQLYDKFAPIMYGVILRITTDKTIADAILVDAFIQLKNQKTFEGMKMQGVCLWLLKHTYATTIDYLRIKKIAVKKNCSLSEILIPPKTYEKQYH